jgi:two-component system OmpR family response regulator
MSVRQEPPPGAKSRILVVDDEASITDAVATALRYEGYEVVELSTGRSALDAVSQLRPSLVVLDVMLPDLTGFEVLRRLRRDGFTVPVILLTARDATEDKIEGLRAGGDDYVTKPFSLGELVARVGAILRRVDAGPSSTRLEFADVVLDEETHEVWRADTPVHLTATEFALLRYFLLNPRRVLSKPQIFEHVWGHHYDDDANVVETFVSYVRKKLDRLGPTLIQTIRGVGYTLRLPEE